MNRFVLIICCMMSCLSASLATAAEQDMVYPVRAVAVPGTFTVLCYHEARDEVRDYPDPFAVDTAALVGQFMWLRGNGYTPVSLDAIIAARQGGKPLPEKAVLLSFDDAYFSFYTRVYPLLREFNFPAVVGVVGKWIDRPHDGSALYGEKSSVPEARFPSWAQLREMSDSGLIEIASHTYDLHRGVLANPQGNLQPAATTRIYDAATGTYENDTNWRTRVKADLAHSAEVIERETGHRPRVMVWPYGSYNDELVHMAGGLGMTVTFTLNDGANTPDVPITALRRILIEHNPALAEFATEVRGPLYPEPMRVVQVRLDDVFSPDAMQQEANLSALLERINVLKPTHVFLQATAANDAAAYFPNRHLSLRADLFNRVAWQLASRIDVKVFAVMPLAVSGLTRNELAEVYEDLARYANFDGLVFAENRQQGTAEDASLLQFTRQLGQRASAFHAPLKTVRAVNSAQGLQALAAEYDYVTLVGESTALVSAVPDIRRKMVFMLHSDSVSQGHSQLAQQMRALQLGGAINFGYDHDDFAHDNPPLAQVAPVMSLRVYPLPLKNAVPPRSPLTPKSLVQ